MISAPKQSNKGWDYTQWFMILVICLTYILIHPSEITSIHPALHVYSFLSALQHVNTQVWTISGPIWLMSIFCLFVKHPCLDATLQKSLSPDGRRASSVNYIVVVSMENVQFIQPVKCKTALSSNYNVCSWLQNRPYGRHRFSSLKQLWIQKQLVDEQNVNAKCFNNWYIMYVV